MKIASKKVTKYFHHNQNIDIVEANLLKVDICVVFIQIAV